MPFPKPMEVKKMTAYTESQTPELLVKYLAYIGEGDLLTHQEEIDLSKNRKDRLRNKH